ncbi:hypothetical protein BJV74DRAFT_374258 [Russula compacta]|nr:hypothetical protein BJV74DRAFT_374258 [Russula compacta]
MDWYIKGLENCVRLKVCTWTRDGSLTSAILKSLGGCPELTDITVNGDHSWHYEPMDLVQLLGLCKISLIMPSMSVLGILPSWLQGTGQSLTSLTLVCKEDRHVTDSLLVSMSQYLPQLNQLHLVGCPRVTNEGVWSMIRNNVRNIKELSLENLSPAFDMLALGGACTRAGCLASLRSFTLTTSHENSTDIRMDGTELLLRESPLEVFQIYVPKSDSEVALADTFCLRVIDRHRDRLVRFSFHQQCISLNVIDYKWSFFLSLPRIGYKRIIRTYLYQYLPKHYIYAQYTSISWANRPFSITSCERWISFASAVQQFRRLESTQLSGK